MKITSNYQGISIEWQEWDNEEIQRLAFCLIDLLKILAAISYRTYPPKEAK